MPLIVTRDAAIATPFELLERHRVEPDAQIASEGLRREPLHRPGYLDEIVVVER